MKHVLLVLAALAMVGTATAPAWAENPFGDPKVDPKAEPKKDPKKVDGEKPVAVEPVKPEKPKGEEGFGAKAAPFGEDIDKIDSTCTLTEDQKTKLTALKADHDKSLAKYDKEAEPKLGKIETRLAKLDSVDPKRDPRAADARKQLEGMKEQLGAQRTRISGLYAAKMFSLLTPEQKAKWNTPVLTDEMVKEFSVVMLDPKQEEKIQAFCALQAKRLNIPLDPVEHAKQIDGLKVGVYRAVLTSKQQLEYRKLKAAQEKPAKGKDNQPRGQM